LGSVRESMSWYKSATPILGETTVKNRRDRLEEMRRMLLAIIPKRTRQNHEVVGGTAASGLTARRLRPQD
jgi:hypothetical protein